ncbi:MAG: hypothetical protein HUU55_05530 [Myxococcales bacterium]|nr:hypothetical protein [Myxococcales bacterium]
MSQLTSAHKICKLDGWYSFLIRKTLISSIVVIPLIITANIAAKDPSGSQTKTIGTRPNPPPGFSAVLRPGPNGNYWVLVPSTNTPDQELPPTGEPPSPADVDPQPNAAEPTEQLLPAPGDLTANLETLAREVVDETNAKRAESGLPPLQPHPVLELAARSHSEDMARTGHLSHTEETRGRETVEGRTRQAGATGWSKLAENVAKGSFSEPIAKTIVTAFYESAGHRKNVMDADQELIGVGVVVNGQTLYVTQVFAANLMLAPSEYPSQSENPAETP